MKAPLLLAWSLAKTDSIGHQNNIMYTLMIFLISTFPAIGQENTQIRDSLVHELEEVTVEATSIKKQMERSPFSVQVLEMKNEYSKSGDVSHLLNQSLGVKMRTNGSLGSSVQINLGGLQGKAVKIFKDGIPIELFGHGFSLGTIPTNMLERIEIYKGAMPIYLASDALGGGMNLVTRSPTRSLVEVAYEVASFNTHRTTAHLFLANPDLPSLYGGINASFNYSDNNYTVNVPFYDSSTGRQTYRNTKRFHDATRSFYGEMYAGLRYSSWADDVRLTLIHSDFFRELQNDAEMTRVYGEAFSKEDSFSAMLNYRKSLLDDRLNVKLTGTYSHFNTRLVDTATVRYNWDGSIQSRNMPVGEVNRGNDQRLVFDLYSARLNAGYALNENHFLEFSNLHHYQRREGSDPLGAISVVEQVDVMRVPAVYRKNNLALALRSLWLRGTLESIIGLKYYNYRTEGFTTDNYNFAWQSSKSGEQFGYLTGIKWNDDNYLLKLSYEYATRLPDEYEIFGDGVMVKENMDLEPEKSHNINLNAQRSFSGHGQNLTIAANLFYRRVKDIIFLQLDIPFNRYINYEESRIKGVEMETRYSPASFMSGGFNLTYQDIRRVNIRELMFRNLEGSRIPNIPYLFGNTFLSMEKESLFKKWDRARIQWNMHYTHRFFLKAVPRNQEPKLFGSVNDFQTSLIIPRDGRTGQFANDLALSYDFSQRKITVAAECRNIGDVRLYDNFNVQRQGRSFHLKLVYQNNIS